MDYLTEISTELGIAPWLFVIIIAWSLVWKLIGMWKAARNKHVVWFIVMALFNTVGILPILYIYIFSDLKDFRTDNMKKSTNKKKSKK